MNSRKRVGPKIEPSGTPSLMDILVKTSHSNPLEAVCYSKKKKWGKNIWPESLWKRPAGQTLSKALDISSATAQVAPNLLKALAILSDTTVRRSAVDREDLNPYWKSEKGHISLGDQKSYYLQVFQGLY